MSNTGYKIKYEQIDGKLIVKDGKFSEHKVLVGPVLDMDEIEYWEGRLDSLNIDYALIQARRVSALNRNKFLGYYIVSDTQIQQMYE